MAAAGAAPPPDARPPSMRELAQQTFCPTCKAAPGASCIDNEGASRSNHKARNDAVREDYWRAAEERRTIQARSRADNFAARLEREREKHPEIRQLFHRAHLPGKEIAAKTGCCWQSIFDALGVKDYDEFNKAVTARNAKRRKEIGWPKIRAAILERDARSCVVTGEQQHLEVHHINGDYEDNRRENLVTLTRRVHKGIENPIPLGWWHRRLADAQARLEHYWKYAAWLRGHGHLTAGVKTDAIGTLWFTLEEGYLPGDVNAWWDRWTAHRDANTHRLRERDALYDMLEGDATLYHEERYVSFDPELGALDVSEDAEILDVCPICNVGKNEPCRDTSADGIQDIE